MSRNENAIERINRMKRESEAAKKATGEKNDIVSQLAHESNGETDFAKLADKLKKRQSEQKVSALSKKVKYTLYLEEDVAAAFNALCLKHGDQRRYANQAFKEFVEKKARELDI